MAMSQVLAVHAAAIVELGRSRAPHARRCAFGDRFEAGGCLARGLDRRPQLVRRQGSRKVGVHDCAGMNREGPDADAAPRVSKGQREQRVCRLRLPICDPFVAWPADEVRIFEIDSAARVSPRGQGYHARASRGDERRPQARGELEMAEVVVASCDSNRARRATVGTAMIPRCFRRMCTGFTAGQHARRERVDRRRVGEVERSISKWRPRRAPPLPLPASAPPTRTRAPALASARVVSSPTPADPPVMTTRRPSSRRSPSTSLAVVRGPKPEPSGVCRCHASLRRVETRRHCRGRTPRRCAVVCRSDRRQRW